MERFELGARWNAARVGLLAGALLGAAACDGGHRGRPSVVLVSVDTLRADHLGAYGYARDTSPRIDRFAEDALVFERCQSHASETRFSVASLLTGFLPHETRVTSAHRLPAGVTTLAEALRDAGYATAAVVSNPVLRGGLGWEQGFDVYDDRMDEHGDERKWTERVAERTTARALELLDELEGRPFFLWVHYQDPHGPYTPPEPHSETFVDAALEPRPLTVNRSLSGDGGIPGYQRLGEQRDYNYYVAQYDGEIRYLDQEVGRLFDGLRTRGLWDEALIVFTADHGESMGEHDHYFAHMQYLYSPLTHVPLILRHGNRFRGRRSERVQHVDVAPTVLSLLGLPGRVPFRGRSLAEPATETRDIFSHINLPGRVEGRRISLVRGDLRVVYTWPTEEAELYDLAADPGEEHDLSLDPRYTEVARELLDALLALAEDDRLQIEVDESLPEYSDEERERLRALGYAR